MNDIHYRKTVTGINTWCGVRRNSYYLKGVRENTSPSVKDVTCVSCLKAATDWTTAFLKRNGQLKTKKGETTMSHLSQKIYDERKEAEAKAIDALSRYKFQMFGYWSAIWVHLNKISEDPQPNPFAKLVKLAKEMRVLAGGNDQGENQDRS